MKQLTYPDIVDLGPCSRHPPDKYIPRNWTWTIRDILKLPNVAPTEKLWVAYRVLDKKTLRLFAVDCARRALARIPNPDPRSLAAINMAEAFAYDRCTEDELREAQQNAAQAAVHAAAHAAVQAAAHAAVQAAAHAAVQAAAHAAAYAAYAAQATQAARKQERETQIIKLIELIEEDV